MVIGDKFGLFRGLFVEGEVGSVKSIQGFAVLKYKYSVIHIPAKSQSEQEPVFRQA